MAPEQTELGAAITPATDIWAYGLIAFYVVTGESYWRLRSEGRDVSGAALLRQIVLDALPSASERAAQLGVAALPVGFDPWFARCVARPPADRFADGAAALADLRKIFDASSPSLAATLPADLAMAKTQAALTPTPGIGATVPLAQTPRPAPAAPPVAPAPAPPLAPVAPIAPLATTDGGVAGVTPAPLAPAAPAAPAAPSKAMRAVAAVALLAAIGGIYAAGTRGGSRQVHLATATSTPAAASASSEPSVLPSKTTPIQPREGKLFSSTPVELKWSHAEDATREHDIEVRTALNGDCRAFSYVAAHLGLHRSRKASLGSSCRENETFSAPRAVDGGSENRARRVRRSGPHPLVACQS